MTTEKDTSSPPVLGVPSRLRTVCEAIHRVFVDYSIIQKVFVLAFTFAIFVMLFSRDRTFREVLSFVGIMLLGTASYFEILVIRDHLWVVEGSVPEMRQWRDHFFSPPTMRMQRLRKLAMILFATVAFAWLYYVSAGFPLVSFLGIIMMITVLYFEILTVRDDVRALLTALKAYDMAKSQVQAGHLHAPAGGNPKTTSRTDGVSSPS